MAVPGVSSGEAAGEKSLARELIVLGSMYRWQVFSPAEISSLPGFSKGTTPNMLIVEVMRGKCKGMQVVVGLDD